MSFLYPAFLFGALLAAIPIVLHLLRRDVAPEVPFSAVRLLRKSPIERSRRRRLRDLILLAARVAALILLATAFARPYSGGASAAASRVRVVAIDRSFSMSAPGTFDRALALGRKAIDEAAAGERVAVVAFDERADVVSQPGTPADARAALAGLAAGYGATRYGTAIDKANDIADGAPGTVVVVTDMQRAGWEDEPPHAMASTLQLRVLDTGGPPPNLAVVRAAAGSERITATVRNGGAETRSGHVHAAVDGREVAAAPFTALPGATVDVAVPYRAPSTGTLSVSVDDPMGIAADNVRFAVLDPSDRPRVLVVANPGREASSGLYVARALEVASSGGDGFEVRTASAPELGSMSADDRARTVAIVLLSTRGLTRQARVLLAGFVRDGGGLLVAASPDVDGAAVASVFDWRDVFGESGRDEPVALAATDLRHPIFRPFGALAANLGQVRFSRGWRVRGEGWDVAARFTDGNPALLDRAEGRGRVVLFASDLDRRWNDFPLHPAFVPFAVESVRYVARSSVNVREYLVGQVPAGAPARPGVFRSQPQNRLVAVNVDPRESATARLGAEEFDRMVPRVPVAAGPPANLRAQQSEARQNLWRYGLMLMLLTLVAESMVGRI